MKLDKKQIAIGASLVFLVGLVVIIVFLFSTKTTDAIKFKHDYESLNKVSSPSGNVYQTLNIDKNNKVKYATLDEAVELVNSSEALIYFGFPNCPWCRGMIETLLGVVGCSCIENIYYVDMTGLRDEYTIEEEEPVIKTEASSSYYSILNKLDSILADYVITDDLGVEYNVGEKRLYVPLVVGIKDGTLVGYYDGLELDEGQTPYDELTDLQKSELEVIFNNIIDSMTKENNVCNEHC